MVEGPVDVSLEPAIVPDLLVEWLAVGAISVVGVVGLVEAVVERVPVLEDGLLEPAGRGRPPLEVDEAVLLVGLDADGAGLDGPGLEAGLGVVLEGGGFLQQGLAVQQGLGLAGRQRGGLLPVLGLAVQQRHRRGRRLQGRPEGAAVQAPPIILNCPLVLFLHPALGLCFRWRGACSAAGGSRRLGGRPLRKHRGLHSGGLQISWQYWFWRECDLRLTFILPHFN
jgi:hypothetical protein